jgi:hypothetical protein
MDIGAMQDPYVVMEIVRGDGEVMGKGKTSVVKSGGCNPVWVVGNVIPCRSVGEIVPRVVTPAAVPVCDLTLQHPCIGCRYSARLDDKLEVRCHVWDKDVFSSDLIGEGVVDVSSVIGRTVVSSSMSCVLVNKRKKKPAGVLTMTVDAALVEAEPLRDVEAESEGV